MAREIRMMNRTPVSDSVHALLWLFVDLGLARPKNEDFPNANVFRFARKYYRV